jgi:hypothetical protein
MTIQAPVTGSRYCGGQPAISVGVTGFPVIKSNTRITHPDFRQEHANADSACNFDTRWDDFDEPLTHADQREEDEDEAFDEDGCECKAVAYASCAVVADDLVGEVGVEAHAGTRRVVSER